MKKLNMRAAGTLSKMWKKLNMQGVSIKGIYDLTDESGFTSVSDDELNAYKSNITLSELEEFNLLDEKLQKEVVAKVKEIKARKLEEADLIDKIIANYYIVEDDFIEIIILATDFKKEELEMMDMEKYFTLLTEVIKENISFFTSLAKLKIK